MDQSKVALALFLLLRQRSQRGHMHLSITRSRRSEVRSTARRPR